LLFLHITFFVIPKQNEGRARNIMKFYELQANWGILLWGIYGTICCECVSICVLGMFLALCFRINTCCGPLCSSPPMSSPPCPEYSWNVGMSFKCELVRFLNPSLGVGRNPPPPSRLKKNFFLRLYSDVFFAVTTNVQCGSLKAL